MRLFIPSLLAFAAASFTAPAQEPVQPEEAVRIAHKLTETVGNPSDAPFTTDVDADKPNGIKAGGAGFMVLPDRKLTTDALEHTATAVTPIGQLWTLQATVAANGKATANDLLRFVKVGEGEKSRKVQLYYLGATRNEAGELQVSIFAKDKTQPILRVPLTKAANTSQSSPLEIDGRKKDEDTGILVIHILGEYAAEVPLMKPQE
jgi:hypothetical protein